MNDRKATTSTSLESTRAIAMGKKNFQKWVSEILTEKLLCLNEQNEQGEQNERDEQNEQDEQDEQQRYLCERKTDVVDLK